MSASNLQVNINIDMCSGLKRAQWILLEARLLTVQSSYLHHGSLGIALFTRDVLPLRQRFYSGERTEELREAIMQLETIEERRSC